MEHVRSMDPDDGQDYKVTYADDLVSGESIDTSAWSVPAGITKDDEDNDTTTATVWLSGGTAGEKYEVTNTITTDNNPARTYSKTLIVPISED